MDAVCEEQQQEPISESTRPVPEDVDDCEDGTAEEIDDGTGTGCESTPSQVGRKSLTGQTCTLKTLIEDEVLTPGPALLEMQLAGKTFTGDLLASGSIRWTEAKQVFSTPSSWVNFCRRSIDPDNTAKATSAWSTIRYKGKRLDSYKLRWYRRQKKIIINANMLEMNQSKGETTDSSSDAGRTAAAAAAIAAAEAEKEAALLRSQNVVEHTTLGLRTHPPPDPSLMIRAIPFSAIERIQPFTLNVSTNALLLIDFHSHLTTGEVTGYLSGTWDFASHCLNILQAFPCRCRLGDKTKGKLVEDEIRANLEQKNLSLVGWYHSHPTTAPHPTVRDSENQLDYQIAMKGENESSYIPCVGLISCPYGSNGAKESSIQFFWVMPPPEYRPYEFGRPMQMIYNVTRDSYLTQDLLLEMRLLAHLYIGGPDAVNFQDPVPEQQQPPEQQQQETSYWEKLKQSLTPNLPRDLQESEGQSVAQVQDAMKNLILVAVIVTLISRTTITTETRKCEEINIPMCRGIGYNSTAMPNMFQHDSQEEAGLEVHQFWPLVEIQCSDDLRFFLCSMYAPICIEDYTKPLPACRSVCFRAKAGCAPIMSQYGFSWPDRMNCEELPVFGDPNNLCMDSKNGQEPSTPSPSFIERFTPAVTLIPNKAPGKEVKAKTTKARDLNVKKLKPTVSENCQCECHAPLIKLDDGSGLRHFNSVETGGISKCLHSCQNVFFSISERVEANQIIVVFALACFVCTLFTVATCILDSDRFKYPERSIIFICGCYLMISAGFIFRWWVGHEAVACDGNLIQYPAAGPNRTNCLVVFILVYFFTIASSVWWVILCFTWFLSAGLKWGSEAIAGYSQYFHLLALLVPTVKSLIILGTGAVDGDSFAGICFVGNLDLENLKKFVLIPLTTCLAVGGVFLVAGFVSLFRVREVIRQQARAKADKLEKLMVRIGIFSILYSVPGGAVIACYYYELQNRNHWERSLTCPCIISADKPVYWFFLLKYIGNLVVGITSGFWIWSPKTWNSWGRLFGRLCCRSRSTVASRSGGSQLMGSQFMAVSSHQRQTYKQIPMAQQVAYSSLSHIESNCNAASVHMKQIPMSHV